MDEPWWLDGAPSDVHETYLSARAGVPAAMLRIGGVAAGLGDVDEGLRWFGAADRTGDPAAEQLVRSLSEVRDVDRADGQPLAWRWHTRPPGARVWVWPGVLGVEPGGTRDEFSRRSSSWSPPRSKTRCTR